MNHDRKALYDADFYAWTVEQAAALRRAGAARINADVDWENVAEEVESMGRSDLRALTSHTARIIEHLLKLEYSPAQEPRAGWIDSVNRHRLDVQLVVADSPSLRPRLEGVRTPAFQTARKFAAESLHAMDGVPPAALPDDCPYEVAQIFDFGWWPVRKS